MRQTTAEKPVHVSIQRLWNYSHFQTELTLDEHVHISDCPLCLKNYRHCSVSQSPKEAENLASGASAA